MAKKVTKKAAKPTKSAKKKPVAKKPVKPSKSSRAAAGRGHRATPRHPSRNQSGRVTRKPAKKVVKKKADVSAAVPEKVDETQSASFAKLEGAVDSTLLGPDIDNPDDDYDAESDDELDDDPDYAPGGVLSRG